MANPNLLRLLLTVQHWVIHLIVRVLNLELRFWLWACALLIHIYLLPLRCLRARGSQLNDGRAHSDALPSSGRRFVYEIIQFPVTDAYKEDPRLIKQVMDFIGAHAPGPCVHFLFLATRTRVECCVPRLYTGLQLEEPTNQFTGFIGWDRKEHHEDVSVFILSRAHELILITPPV